MRAVSFAGSGDLGVSDVMRINQMIRLCRAAVALSTSTGQSMYLPIWEGEAPAEPRLLNEIRLGGSLARPFALKL